MTFTRNQIQQIIRLLSRSKSLREVCIGLNEIIPNQFKCPHGDY